jgi:hypothetical protein
MERKLNILMQMQDAISIPHHLDNMTTLAATAKQAVWKSGYLT